MCKASVSYTKSKIVDLARFADYFGRVATIFFLEALCFVSVLRSVVFELYFEGVQNLNCFRKTDFSGALFRASGVLSSVHVVLSPKRDQRVRTLFQSVVLFLF